MDSTTWKRAKQVFHEALEKSVPDRRGFMASACGDDCELRARVEALLAAHDEAGEFMVDPTVPQANEVARAAAVLTSSQPSERLGASIGPYKLLQVIGEGGFGVVYMAEQQEPVRRKVALKIIKLGMDTRQVIARFEAERQALALMEHPNIARVLDAGATETGRPYFVMELVKGVPITEYCDANRLATHERLDLFREVCAAVQHAHQKGIIHRDIKPSNVLVTLHDGKPVPKVIDFGIAKATHQRLTEKTLFTEYGQFVGTPAYMSPEQAEMTGEDIDTRSDVYSLGALLYELLVGALPFDSKELRKAGFDEIRRKIREEEPSKPSTRISTLGDAATDSARKRRTDPASLTRCLRGDLDWITLRALEKDRNRRYGSPQELAEDIRRHLTDEPVLASPPSAAYRAKKFIKRHSAGVAIGTAGILALVAFAATMAVQAKRIAAERDQVNAAAERAMRSWDLRIASAERHLLQTIETLKPVLGDDHPDTLSFMNSLANLYDTVGRLGEAEPLYLHILETRKRVLGDEHPDTLGSMGNLVLLYRDQRRYDEAEPLYLHILEARKRVLGDEHPNTLASMDNLADVYTYQGRYDEAEPLYLQTLETRKRVRGNHSNWTFMSMRSLATLYRYQGRYDEAEPLYFHILEAYKRNFGDASTGNIVHELGCLYRDQGRHDESRRWFERAQRILKAEGGSDDPYVAENLVQWAALLRKTGDDAGAERMEARAKVIRGE